MRRFIEPATSSSASTPFDGRYQNVIFLSDRDGLICNQMLGSAAQFKIGFLRSAAVDGRAKSYRHRRKHFKFSVAVGNDDDLDVKIVRCATSVHEGRDPRNSRQSPRGVYPALGYRHLGIQDVQMGRNCYVERCCDLDPVQLYGKAVPVGHPDATRGQSASSRDEGYSRRGFANQEICLALRLAELPIKYPKWSQGSKRGSPSTARVDPRSPTVLRSPGTHDLLKLGSPIKTYEKRKHQHICRYQRPDASFRQFRNPDTHRVPASAKVQFRVVMAFSAIHLQAGAV